MTVHRIRTCVCGHAESVHVAGGGACTYGHDHAMGGCDCPKFRRRSRAAAASSPASDGAIPIVAAPMLRDVPSKDPIVVAICEAIRGLDIVRGALSALARERHRTLDAQRFAKVAIAKRDELAAPPIATVDTGKPTNGAIKLRAGERAMLEVLARYAPRTLARAELGVLVGIRARGTTFTSYLGTLRRHGLVRGTDECLALSAAGAALVRDVDGPLSTGDILTRWVERLRAGERAMLRAVVSGGARTRYQLAAYAEIDAKGTTFTSYLGTLKRNDLVVVRGSHVEPGPAFVIKPPS